MSNALSRAAGNTVSTIVALLYLAALGLGVLGWIFNIAKIIGSAGDPITGLFIARIAGVPIAILGAVLGYF